MQLLEYRVRNFRSVEDSGPINAGKITTIVGRNESGKTNLLLALHSLKPAGGPKALSPIKDFPRSRRLSECTDDTPVLDSQWQLTPTEQAKLAVVFPRAKGVTKVHVSRRYKASTYVAFIDLPEIPFAVATVQSAFKAIKADVTNAASNLDDAAKAAITAALSKLEGGLSTQKNAAAWAPMTAAVWGPTATPAIAAFRTAIGATSLALSPAVDTALKKLETDAALVAQDPDARQAGINWIIEQLPTFVYLDDYPELRGHQNIAEYLARKSSNTLTDADLNFEKLCKVADLTPQQLQELHGQNDHETRNQLANRAGAVVTRELRRLWKDRQLKVRFSLDANHFDTLISDPNALYDVEINLDERSRGFKWFFSLYVTFAADTHGGSADNAILLLDEPGLYLHMTSQGDLLSHLSKDLKNQVVYTTHSPFMIPTDNLDAIRTVNIGQDAGTTVTNDPTGDSRTLFPLQAALGWHLAQHLFIGPSNLIVEGVTDYWYLSCASEFLRGEGGTALPPELALTPAGGAQKVTYMVALLSSERLNVLVLLDEEKKARTARDEMVKEKLIREDNVVFVSEAFPSPAPAEVDIEDLLNPDVFASLVQDTYAKELAGKTLQLNANIPRIVKRYEDAFAALGLEFQKTRPARRFLNLAASDPAKVFTNDARGRFEALFKKIGETLQKHAARATKPFN